MANMNERIALSVQEAADMLGISKAKMYGVLKSDDCDFAFRLGGRRLISRSKLEAWIDRQTKKGRENNGTDRFGRT